MNNNWTIEYWHPDNAQKLSSVEYFLDQLTDEQFKSIAKELKLLELCGNNLKLPHSKSLGKCLFELRERKFGFRIYYSFIKNRIIVLLNAGDKSSQNKDIKLARERLTRLLKQV